jgi:hypothetical protein
LDVPFPPLSLPGGAQQWYDGFTNLLPILLLAALAGLTWRYRRSTQTVRAQIKWVVAAAAVMVIVTVATTMIFPAIASNLDSTVGPMLTLPLIPVAIGIAVLRLRLYDIDRAISRTLSYAIVTAVLIGVYAAIVVSASRLLHTKSPVVVAAATLAAAAVAQPLLRRVRAMVDRRFDRVRYDQLRTVDEFGSALSQQVQTEEVSRSLVATVHGTLQPVTAGLWLRDSS